MFFVKIKDINEVVSLLSDIEGKTVILSRKDVEAQVGDVFFAGPHNVLWGVEKVRDLLDTFVGNEFKFIRYSEFVAKNFFKKDELCFIPLFETGKANENWNPLDPKDETDKAVGFIIGCHVGFDDVIHYKLRDTKTGEIHYREGQYLRKYYQDEESMALQKKEEEILERK